MTHWQALLEGILLSAGLIIAIGAQNAFVIRQGITGQHVLAVVITCICADALLIAMGALGLGGLVTSMPMLRMILILFGIGFLGWYGLSSWWRAIRGSSSKLIRQQEANPTPLGKIILLALGFSLLNPQAFVDTVVLIGGLAAQYDEFQGRVAFTMGAVLVSVVWFFSLAYGAKLLQRAFRKPLTARIFDGVVGTIMLGLMTSLAISEWID
jgi:L-lysine exporter family protein LysE/ArgO